MTTHREPRLYRELAAWWPLLSPPSHYVEEAADLLPSLMSAVDPPPRTILELGCGGGSLAFHLKRDLQLTLTDRSAAMLDVSRAVNPECEHIVGDMRTLDLGRTFDAVLIHDAVMYLTDEAAMRATLATVSRHCRHGGVALLVPDCVTETFEPDSSTGGEDAPDGRGLRYLEWSWDPDANDARFVTAYSFLMRHADASVTSEHDVHELGLFPRATWLEWMREAGFEPSSRLDPWKRDVFLGLKL